MSHIPPDALRERRMPLDEWIDSFSREHEGTEEYQRRCKAAKMLLEHPVASTVISSMEAYFVRCILDTLPSDTLTAEKARHGLNAVRKFRQDLEALAADIKVDKQLNSD